jgi:hypothetical protein
LAKEIVAKAQTLGGGSLSSPVSGEGVHAETGPDGDG